jgi:hypothetical protein
MNFLPLAIWAVGFLAVATWEEVSREKKGIEAMTEKTKEWAALLWWWGCVLFLVLGVVSL